MKRKKIVYIVSPIYPSPDERECIGQQLVWLSENTTYEIHVIIPDSDFFPENYIPPTFTNIVYPQQVIPTIYSKSYSGYIPIKKKGILILQKIGIISFCKRIQYKNFIKKELKKLQDTDLFIIPIHRDTDFLSSIRNGNKIIGELSEHPKYFTDLHKRNWLNKWKFFFLQKRLKRFDVIVVNTPKMGAAISEYTKTPTYCIPIHLKKWPDTPNDVTKSTIVSAIGSYSENNFIPLISAWQRVSARHPEWRLHLYGKGNEETIKAEIKNKHLSRYIYCYPLTDSLIDVYTKSSILLLPSNQKTDMYRIKEAFSYGLPVVTFGVTDVYGIIHDEKNGFVINGNNWNDFIIKTRILINNEELRKEMSLRARETATNYQLDKIMADWILLIENISTAF